MFSLPSFATGLAVNHCKALAAAIFKGDSTKVQYVELQEGSAPQAIASDQVDVVAMEHTLDAGVRRSDLPTGLSFSPATFYDGLTFGGISP